MKKIITIICALGVTLCMTACGAENKTTDAGQTDQNVEITVSAEDASQTEEPVKDETSETTVVTEPTPVVENTNVEDSMTETVVDTTTETEVATEEQVYTDFDAWFEEITNDDSLHPHILVWNADTNKHEIVSNKGFYQGLEENDKIYVVKDDVKELICNGVGIYDAEDDLYKNKYEGQLYIELENIKLDSQNNIQVRFYSRPDSLYIWEVE